MCRFLEAVEQNFSRTPWTALVMLYGTDLANFILLLTTTLPFLKFRISSFLKPVRFACRYGSSCRQKQNISVWFSPVAKTILILEVSHGEYEMKFPLKERCFWPSVWFHLLNCLICYTREAAYGLILTTSGENFLFSKNYSISHTYGEQKLHKKTVTWRKTRKM